MPAPKRATDAPLSIRPLRESDLDEAASVLAEAFSTDPVWGPAFPAHPRRLEYAAAHWRFVTAQAIPYESSHVAETPDGAIASLAVWFPHGAEEMAAEDLPAYEELLRSSIGEEAAAAIFSSGARFGAARPAEPHAYLSLLAVAPEARGLGYGMRLVAAALADYDREGTRTYLESSNAANDARYERLGYVPATRIEFPGGVPVQTYLREPAAN